MAAMLTGGGRYALDVPVAAFAGLSVAFLVFAMPDDLLAELIASTGLASLLPAAEPPLGLKARIGIGAAGAMAVFAAAFLTLRWLDRLGSRPAEPSQPGDERETPRLRRRDLHPDAPPRPPIMATYELGEPEQEAPASPVAAEPAVHRARDEIQDEWLFDRPSASEQARVEPYPSLPLEPAAASPERSSMPDLPAPSGSLDELMARLELGLARRREDAEAPSPDPTPIPAQAPPATDPPPSAEPKPFPEAGDERLQSAIASLQRLAARDD
ncbi:hypothetical protein [Sphingosinicella sp. CPCC 101087]|uniref:hypothetical protein n=1 Tax=Sphingosinicella sp. CPCC 101087 TaxID=2497754 RepID=UPI00101DE596|nr:hypothetical protein [Sphingosinicella sp. CPCC 101087]